MLYDMYFLYCIVLFCSCLEQIKRVKIQKKNSVLGFDDHYIRGLTVCFVENTRTDTCFTLLFVNLLLALFVRWQKHWWEQEQHGQGPIPQSFFIKNSNYMDISFCSNLNCTTTISTNFCTCHNSCTVVACAKVCSDLMPRNRIAVYNFGWIWAVKQKM